MRAIHKYKNAAQRGDREAMRRIGQSHGYKWSIHDMPKMIALLKRAGIEIESPYEQPRVDNTQSTTQFKEDVVNSYTDSHSAKVVDTIKL